jgi:predicted NAD/FAD-binding protein
VVVSLNPLAEPRPDTVIAEFDYEHPVFDAAAVRAQARLPHVQGRNGVWFAGAWTGYGFHEDGLKSGLVVAESLRARGLRPRRIAA